MKDQRALASTANLNSYRAWQREGVKRWMLGPIFLLTAGLPLLNLVITPFENDPRRFLLVAGTAFAVYLATGLGWLFFAIRGLNAWKRAHPWEPPKRR